jgi:hypothetical protein
MPVKRDIFMPDLKESPEIFFTQDLLPLTFSTNIFQLFYHLLYNIKCTFCVDADGLDFFLYRFILIFKDAVLMYMTPNGS